MKSATVYCDGTVVGNDSVVLTDVVSVDRNMPGDGAPYCGTITLAVTDALMFTRAKYTPPPSMHPDTDRLIRVREILASARVINEIIEDTFQRALNTMK